MKMVLAAACVVVFIMCAAAPAHAADCQAKFERYKKEHASIEDIKPVERCFEKMIRRNPDNVAAYIGLAEVKYRQADFYSALHQLDLARTKDVTKQEHCTIEWLASWVYGHLGTTAARGVYKQAIKACHDVDSGKEAVAKMFLRNSKKARKSANAPSTP